MASENGPKQKSIYLSAGRPVKVLASPVCAPDWLTLAETSPSSILRSLNATVHAGWFGRTYPASCRPTADGTLVPLSGRWSNAGMASPTECLTLSIAEFHNDAVACSLSDILERGTLPDRFYLSATACSGILRRADRRGKVLPEPLRLALEKRANS